MTTVCGPHFRVGPEFGEFFDIQGKRVNDDMWIYYKEGDESDKAIWPALVSPMIRDCLKSDEKNGRGDDVAQIHLHQRAAVFLALEKVLLPQHVEDVTVRVNYFVRIPLFFFDERLYELHVVKDLDQDVLTADANGVPIL